MKCLNWDDPITIPLPVAVCPYCGGSLLINPQEIYEAQDGWMLESFETECNSEPDIESDDWELWWHNHSLMPYIYQLPVNEKIKKWVNNNYRFK